MQIGTKLANGWDASLPSNSSPIGKLDIFPAIETSGTSSSDSKFNLVAGPRACALTANNTTSSGNVIWTSGVSKPTPSPLGQKSMRGAEKRSVKGVVLHLDDQSVQSEILHGSNRTIVWIPRSMFPADATAGYAFDLSVDTEGGYQVPRVTPRTPVPDPGLQRRLSELLDAFESE